jgi:hypothetical protein
VTPAEPERVGDTHQLLPEPIPEQGSYPGREITGADQPALGEDLQNTEPRLLERLGEGSASEVMEMHFHQPGPSSPHQPGGKAPGIHRVNNDDSSRFEDSGCRAEHRKRIEDMLDDVPHRYDVERRVCEFAGVEGAREDLETAGASLRHGPSRRLDAGGRPAAVPGNGDERPRVGSHVEQPARGRMLFLQALQSPMESRKTSWLFLQIQRILDLGVSRKEILLGGTGGRKKTATGALENLSVNSISRVGASEV